MEQPVKIYAKDFDGNGSMDPVTFAYYKDRSGVYNSYPSHFWDDLYGQSILFRRKYERYKSFALSTENDLFTAEEKEGALVLTGNYDKSAFIKNNGNGVFEVYRLPTAAQIAPVNGILAEDVNRDGYLDVVLVGNDFGNEIFTGRLDALVGLVLLGNGKGDFNSVRPNESGFIVPGDAKSLVKLSAAQGSPLLIASQNRNSLLVFKKEETDVSIRTLTPPLNTMAVIFELENGKKQRFETSFGSGFLSQSSREITLPKGLKSITLVDYKGESAELDLNDLD
jgi:hypothetical protein